MSHYWNGNNMKKIIISGDIGFEVLPRDISDQLFSANGDDIDVYISSPGGFVFDGIEIYNSFREYKRKYPGAQIIATINGLAASMASYLAVNPAFDLVVAEDNATFMIHNVYGGAIGDYRELRKTADIYEGLSELLGSAYADKTGKTKNEIKSMMDDESWFFGSEILESGFVDEIIKTENNEEKNIILSTSKLKFKNMSEKIKNKEDIEKISALFEKKAQIPANAGKNIKEVSIMPTLKEFLAENPAAKTEFESKLNENFEAGKNEVVKKVKIAANFLKPESSYPSPVKNIAIDVINGDKSVDSLMTAVAVFDALRENENSKNAVEENKKIGETAGEQQEVVTGNGEIKNIVDFNAEIRRSKAMLGQEVK